MSKGELIWDQRAALGAPNGELYRRRQLCAALIKVNLRIHLFAKRHYYSTMISVPKVDSPSGSDQEPAALNRGAGVVPGAIAVAPQRARRAFLLQPRTPEAVEIMFAVSVELPG